MLLNLWFLDTITAKLLTNYILAKAHQKAYTSKIFAKINAKNRAHACYLLGLKALV